MKFMKSTKHNNHDIILSIVCYLVSWKALKMPVQQIPWPFDNPPLPSGGGRGEGLRINTPMKL